VSRRVDPRRPAHGAGGGDSPRVLGDLPVPVVVLGELPPAVPELVEPFDVVELGSVVELEAPEV
jgi:hypothetical protein